MWGLCEEPFPHLQSDSRCTPSNVGATASEGSSFFLCEVLLFTEFTSSRSIDSFWTLKWNSHVDNCCLGKTEENGRKNTIEYLSHRYGAIQRSIFRIFLKRNSIVIREGGNINWIPTSCQELSEALYSNDPFNLQNKALLWLLLSSPVYGFITAQRGLVAWFRTHSRQGAEQGLKGRRVQSLSYDCQFFLGKHVSKK